MQTRVAVMQFCGVFNLNHTVCVCVCDIIHFLKDVHCPELVGERGGLIISGLDAWLHSCRAEYMLHCVT